MTQEEKELLFKDLSARLLYGVRADAYPFITHEYVCGITKENVNLQGTWIPIENVKPYLRPLSSVTNEECRQLFMLLPTYFVIFPESIYTFNNSIHPEHLEIITDFYNKHNLDWRGLIPKGLALEESENMYKTN